MALDSFKSSQSNGNAANESAIETSKNRPGDRFMGDETPNREPTDASKEREPVDIEIVKDQEFVDEVAEMWAPDEKDSMVEAVRVWFNDGSTWCWPLKSWDKDYARIRKHFVEKYVPDIVRHNAKMDGEDPDEAIKGTMFEETDDKPDWFDKIENTDLSESNREWFNKNADYLPDMLKEVKSESDDVDIDTDGTDWTDDW